MSSEFYRAFEDKFRGGRELIKSRLAQYLPFLDPLKRIDPDVNAVDLGCGRGEWLELLDENGISARGVDLDKGMLAACTERNLSVETGDAIAFLKGLPDESVSILSAFHVVEHISFDQLKDLVQESLRVLKSAGLLILETPNPENIIVGTTNFYLDPSHEKPIPPQLLEFLPQHFGFNRAKVVRLQEPRDIESRSLNLLDVLVGVSPDYAVIAQKTAPSNELELFETAFGRDYGISLEQLAMNYSKQVDDREALAEQRSRADVLQRECDASRARLEHLAEEKGQRERALQTANERVDQLQNSTQQLQLALDSIRSEFAEFQRLSAMELAEARRVSAAELAEAQRASERWSHVADGLEREIQVLYRSRSWRITWPLRKSGQLFRWVLRLPKRCLRWLVVQAMSFVIKRTELSGWCSSFFRRLPIFHQKLRELAHARGLINIHIEAPQDKKMTDVPTNLTSHARRIYLDLANAIDNDQAGGN